jgi:hypothetical protein
VQGDALQNAVAYVAKIDQGKEWGQAGARVRRCSTSRDAATSQTSRSCPGTRTGRCAPPTGCPTTS